MHPREPKSQISSSLRWDIYMLFAGWEVLIVKTVTEVSKMLHEAAERGQHFQDRDHSLLLYGPALRRQVTYYFFS